MVKLDEAFTRSGRKRIRPLVPGEGEKVKPSGEDHEKALAKHGLRTRTPKATKRVRP